MGESELTTKPTLDIIIERINVQGDEMRAGFESIGKRFESVENRLERIEIRLDRVGV